MYGPLEAALIAWVDGVVPGAPVTGTLDIVDLDEGPAVQVQVAWLGYRVAGQAAARSVAALDQRFAVLLLVNGPRIDAARRQQVEQSFGALVERVLAFKFDRFIRPSLESTPEPGFSGALTELGVYFSLKCIAQSD